MMASAVLVAAWAPSFRAARPWIPLRWVAMEQWAISLQSRSPALLTPAAAAVVAGVLAWCQRAQASLSAAVLSSLAALAVAAVTRERQAMCGAVLAAAARAVVAY